MVTCGSFIQVEDFAERSQNCARAVREKEFDIIYQSFRDTHSHLGRFSGSIPQMLEIQQVLFGVRSLKRTSEEPLVQPVEKHLKVSNHWTTQTAPYVGSDRVSGFAVVEPRGGVSHAHYSNHDQHMQQRPPYQSYPEHFGWGAPRGTIPSIPAAAQAPSHYAEPRHVQMRPEAFPRQQLHHPSMRYPAYNVRSEIRPYNHYPGGPGMVGPPNYGHHPPRPQHQGYHDPMGYRPDTRRDQGSNWRHHQSPHRDHASQGFVHRPSR